MKSVVPHDDGAAADHRLDQFGGERLGLDAPQPCGVGQSRACMRVGLDLVGGSAASNHKREEEDSPCLIPHRAVRVVDEALRPTPCPPRQRVTFAGEQLDRHSSTHGHEHRVCHGYATGAGHHAAPAGAGVSDSTVKDGDHEHHPGIDEDLAASAVDRPDCGPLAADRPDRGAVPSRIRLRRRGPGRRRTAAPAVPPAVRRLRRHAGSAIYRASHDDYPHSYLPTGHGSGAVDDALNTASGLYLADPTGWT